MDLAVVSDPVDVLQSITSLGAAGIIGWMWLWERRTGRDREAQLDQAHQRIIADQIHLETVLHTLAANTEAVTKLIAVCEEMARELERRPGCGHTREAA
jgi:hypothetical protein